MKRLLKIFSFNGVASRKEWWLVYIGWWIIMMTLAQLDVLIAGNSEEVSNPFAIFILISIWPLFATQIRRWHDRDKSGLWCLINAIPIIGSLWAFVELGFFPSVGTHPWGNKNEYREPIK